MLLLGSKNTTSQVVPSLGLINLGTVYRRYDKKSNCGFRAFDFNSTSIAFQQSGIYHLTATATFTGATAGEVTVQLLINGQAIDGAFATETITTVDTEFRSITIDYYILVDKDFILGSTTPIAQSISLQNTGDVDATFTSVVVNVDKNV